MVKKGRCGGTDAPSRSPRERMCPIMELFKRFARFVVPSIVSMWIFSLYTIVDGICVAHGVGDQALAAVNLSMPFVSLIFTLGILLATGTSTVISIALGQKNLDQARNYFNQNLVVTLLLSLLLGLGVVLNLERVALFLGATDSTLTYVKEYVGIIALFTPFFTLSYNLEVQVKANGAPQISAVGVTACGLMNAFLDYLFVMHFHWGVWGAALATGLAQVTSTTIFLVYFLTHRERLHLGRFHPNWKIYQRILPLGLSDGLSELSNGLVIFLFNQVILHVLGEDAIVTYTIISYVNTLVLMTMIGTAQGLQPLVSFHKGAEEVPVCHRLLRYALGTVALLSLTCFALVQLGASGIVSIFLESGNPLILPSVRALRIYALVFLLFGFNVILSAFFTAMERPSYAFPISIGRSLVLIAGSLFLLSALFEEIGIWLAPTLSESLCLLLSLFFLLRYRKTALLPLWTSSQKDPAP